MNQKPIHAVSCLLVTVVVCAATVTSAGEIEGDPSDSLPRVLLIGDSISGGYAGPVTAMLRGKAIVRRASNGGTTLKGLEELDKILGDGPWDVIHFNWGLHDMTWQFRMKPEDRGIDKYEERLEKLVARLKKTDAKLIWGTTTPWCPEVYQYIVDRFNRKLRLAGAEQRKWQEAALRVMKQHEIQVNDLYALLLPELNKYLKRPDDIHFNAEGSKTLGKRIAEVIGRELETREKTRRSPTPDVNVDAAAKETTSLPRVLLIGDSICGGYQRVVKRELAGKADVVKNSGNAQYTGTGLEKIDEWIGDGRWDTGHDS